MTNKPNKKSRRLVLYIAAAVVLALVISWGVPKGVNGVREYLKTRDHLKDVIIADLKDSISEIQISRSSDRDTVYIDIENSKNYYYEFTQERQRAKIAQDYINSLDTLRASRRILDSLADHAKYK
tara:strand:+ start:21077 stop:21451 length:375 start_codon:yes stop_codon:yes gene_type:complete